MTPIKGYNMMMDGCTVILNLVFSGSHQRTMLYPGFFSSVFMLVGVSRVSLALLTYVVEYKEQKRKDKMKRQNKI